MTTVWIVIGAACAAVLIAEAALFAPEKMPWNNRRKERERNAGKR